MRILSFHTNEQGQALVSLLFFSLITVIITTASVVIILSNSVAANSTQQGAVAYSIAESGAENASLRLLRDPTYTGETLSVNGGTAVIQVSGSNPYTITSSGTIGNFKRTITVVVSYTNNVMSVTSWKETY